VDGEASPSHGMLRRSAGCLLALLAATWRDAGAQPDPEDSLLWLPREFNSKQPSEGRPRLAAPVLPEHLVPRREGQAGPPAPPPSLLPGQGLAVPTLLQEAAESLVAALGPWRPYEASRQQPAAAPAATTAGVAAAAATGPAAASPAQAAAVGAPAAAAATAAAGSGRAAAGIGLHLIQQELQRMGFGDQILVSAAAAPQPAPAAAVQQQPPATAVQQLVRGEVGSEADSAVAGPSMGFTASQLEVLRRQIIAFKVLKSGPYSFRMLCRQELHKVQVPPLAGTTAAAAAAAEPAAAEAAAAAAEAAAAPATAAAAAGATAGVAEEEEMGEAGWEEEEAESEDEQAGSAAAGAGEEADPQLLFSMVEDLGEVAGALAALCPLDDNAR
jgi:hypothetical protein